MILPGTVQVQESADNVTMARPGYVELRELAEARASVLGAFEARLYLKEGVRRTGEDRGYPTGSFVRVSGLAPLVPARDARARIGVAPPGDGQGA
jgi:hypothetical protein